MPMKENNSVYWFQVWCYQAQTGRTGDQNLCCGICHLQSKQGHWPTNWKIQSEVATRARLPSMHQHYAVRRLSWSIWLRNADFVVMKQFDPWSMGYSSEMAVERGYRDQGSTDIWSTNEINVCFVADTAMKRAMKGDFDLSDWLKRLLHPLIRYWMKRFRVKAIIRKSPLYKELQESDLALMHAATKHFDKKSYWSRNDE